MKHRASKKLPRKSSPAGVEARKEIRVDGYDQVPAAIKGGFKKPGSGNSRKIGR